MTKRRVKRPPKGVSGRHPALERRSPGFFTRLRTVSTIAKQHPFITLATSICLLGLVVWGIVALLASAEIGCVVGNRAPDFTLQTTDGESVTLSDSRNKIVMLNFWNLPSPSWYPEYCSEEGLYMQAVLDERPDEELAILTIAYEANGVVVQKLMTRHGFTFPLLIDSEGKVRADYDVVCDPTHFFIDTQGVIKAVVPGPFHSQDEIEGILDSIRNRKQIKSTTPTISDVSASSITDTSAVITWITDEPATSQVVIVEPVEFWIPRDDALVTNHSVSLSGLAPGTTYHFRALSTYNFENPTVAQRYSFTTLTDISPPEIGYVDVSNITQASATITWITNEPATSQVEYGLTDVYGSATPTDEKLPTSHSVTLTRLEPDTVYHFRVKSRDASGNEATSEKDPAFATLSSIPTGPAVGKRAPHFTLQTIDGESVTLSDFQGKMIMVNFWVSRCSACTREVPYIQAVFENWPDEELVILAVNVRQSAAAVRSFIDSEGLTFPVLLDSEGVVDKAYQPPSFPTTFFIDGEGIIREVKEGPFRSQEEIESIISSIIADK